MVSVYEYFCYREFLNAYYHERKQTDSFFSYRFMAGKLGIDHSLLVKILSGKRHISDTSIPQFIKLCKFTKRESAYFENLVLYEKAPSEKQSQIYFEKLLQLKGHRSSQIEKYRYEYFQKWYYSAVRSILGFFDFKDDYKALAEKVNPPITAAQAHAAVDLLLNLEFIKKGADGRYQVTDAHITTGEKWEAFSVKDYQKQTILLSAESLERDPKDIRDISSVTMSMDGEAFEDVRLIIQECRAAIIRRIDQIPDQKPDSVYQLNMQLIPLSRTGIDHE